MRYVYNDKVYEVLIERKNNKNTYIRLKNDSIVVTTSYFVSDKMVKDILDKNSSFLSKAIKHEEIKKLKDENFYYLGKMYNVIIAPFNSINTSDCNIYVKEIKVLNKWIKKQTFTIFSERLNYWVSVFTENIPKPNLKIRKMTSRWGVCNRKNNNVTLNSELIKYDIKQIDYVIIHELSHFVHFNHSKEFWNTVSKYCNDYKLQRKILKDN